VLLLQLLLQQLQYYAMSCHACRATTVLLLQQLEHSDMLALLLLHYYDNYNTVPCHVMPAVLLLHYYYNNYNTLACPPCNYYNNYYIALFLKYSC